MEHKTLTGIRQGGYCKQCGGSANMVGTGHGGDKCIANPEAVRVLDQLNRPERGIKMADEEEDMVNSPAHYKAEGRLECIDEIQALLTATEFYGYCKGNALKYIYRAGHKGDMNQDLDKAEWYSRMATGDDPRLDKKTD